LLLLLFLLLLFFFVVLLVRCSLLSFWYNRLAKFIR